ncbi:MAG: hypothetical protein ABSA02_19685 [Trebonia sp.]|jgi:hypothetical protein
MRYRLMASYLGASYQAAVGPSDRDVTLFAAPPPPEEHGFSPVPGGGIWRKQVRLDDLDGLWESRPIGSYHGEPCLVLDDLGDRLHIVYLGMDERRAGQLGYWQVDRGVFEVVVQRHEVTDLAEERHEFPIALLLSALPRASAPRALNAGAGGAGNGSGSGLGPGSGSRSGADAGNGGSMAGRMALASDGQGSSAQWPGGPSASSGLAPNGGQPGVAAWNGQPATAGAYQLPTAGPQPPQPAAQQPMGPATPQPMTQPGGQAAGTAQPQAPTQAAPPQATGGPSGASQAPVVSQQFPNATQPQGAQQAFMGQPTAQPGMTQPGLAQPGLAQPGMAQQFPGGTAAPAAQQATAAPLAASAQPPSAVVAWHGSPVPDGNGTWYYQPNIDPQTAGGTAQSGTAQNGISQNVLPQNLLPQNGVPQNGLSAGGYAPAEQGVPAAVQSNGLTAAPQFAQPVQSVPAAGYQQTPPPPPTVAGQQLTPPAAPPAPQFQPPAAAPAGLADAGPSGGTAGRTAAPVNLGMPLSGQAAPATAPTAAMPAPPAPAAPPVPPAVAPPETNTTGPLPAMPVLTPTPAPTSAPAQAPRPATAPAPPPAAAPPRPAPAGALGKLTGAASAVRGRRAARKPRLAMSAIFADLVDMADVPRSSYAVDEEVTGAMCLFKTDGGYEVFSCAEDARHEVRFFEDEEAAYFYLFGVLAAEALRNGRLAPRRG